MEEKIAFHDSNVSTLFGIHDVNIKILEKEFNVNITYRDGNIKILGEKSKDVKNILDKLINILSVDGEITEQKIKYFIDLYKDNAIDQADKLNDSKHICLTVSGKSILPKTVGQKAYAEAIDKNTVVFGVGPAGTGKTYLAMAKAITAFKNDKVNRIILTRPAIEAGENLGFLPGDLQQKVDPYLRPLYDALYEIMGGETFLKNMEKGLIEVAPLAYMRGRTLDNAFIVLDEAQNTTPEQMKMFLTRIGFGSKAVVTGDVTQIDLPRGKVSGLNQAVKVLDNVDDIAICTLTNRDVVRAPLVQNIIKAYEKFDKKEKYNEEKKSSSRRVGGRYEKGKS
ncbi:MAG: PhoH family protein [Lachnospirales bacterium]